MAISRVPVMKLNDAPGDVIIQQDREREGRLFVSSCPAFSLSCNQTWELIETLTQHAEALWDK